MVRPAQLPRMAAPKQSFGKTSQSCSNILTSNLKYNTFKPSALHGLHEPIHPNTVPGSPHAVQLGHGVNSHVDLSSQASPDQLDLLDLGLYKLIVNDGDDNLPLQPCTVCSLLCWSCPLYIPQNLEIIFQIFKTGLPNQDRPRLPLSNSQPHLLEHTNNLPHSQTPTSIPGKSL